VHQVPREVFKCSHPEIGAGAPFFHRPKMLVLLNKLGEMQLKVCPLKGKVLMNKITSMVLFGSYLMYPVACAYLCFFSLCLFLCPV